MSTLEINAIENIVVICPHCNDPVSIEKVNCAIFRHGILIATKQQMNPHASKAECDILINNKLIYGCGKPFKIIKNGTDYEAIICEYV